MQKKLYLGTDKQICGVCSGIAEYFDIDVTIVRLIAVLSIFTGGGVLAYFVAAMIIPPRP